MKLVYELSNVKATVVDNNGNTIYAIETAHQKCEINVAALIGGMKDFTTAFMAAQAEVNAVKGALVQK